VIAAKAVMLIAATTPATNSAFAHKKRKSYSKSQAVSHVNYVETASSHPMCGAGI
jgi:hypothetical protein